MTWITDADLEQWQETVSRGEELCVDQCRHLLAEVRRLRRGAAALPLLKQQLEQAWGAERVTMRERDVAREEADVLGGRLAWYEEKLESLTL